MDELAVELAQIIADFQSQALSEYKMAIQRQGLEFTKRLEASFVSTVRAQAQQYVYECEIKFLDYGRYRDMKILSVGRKMAPQEAIEYWIEKMMLQKSPDEFLKGVWARKYGRIKSQSKMIRDIAWGVRIARRRKIEHIRTGRGWYNKTTGVQFAQIGEKVRQAAALFALRHLKEVLT